MGLFSITDDFLGGEAKYETTLNVLDGIRDIEKAIGPNVPALETRAKTSISDKLAVGLVLEQTKGILNALSNDIKAKTTIAYDNVITQTAKEVENMVVPGGISSLTSSLTPETTQHQYLEKASPMTKP